MTMTRATSTTTTPPMEMSRTEVFDVDEYDAIYANFVEARSKMNQMRVNRGFYPVVALIDSSGKGGSNRSKSKGKQKGKR